MLKIAFIGAGSVVFARNLLEDILSFPALADSEIALMDVDPDRLARTETVASGLVEAVDAPASVEATTDRREALRGADYVLNMIHVGGREPFENEIEIPREYGVNQAVGDTLGPGGVFRLLRTYPAMLAIARDMEAVCPDARLLNYTNPMAMLCWAIDRETDVEVVGLCHSVQHTAAAFARYVDVPVDELDYWVAGINHMAWFLDARHDGKDLYPALEVAVEDPETYKRDNVRFEILEHFGAFVTESSHHMSEYVPYFRTDEETIETFTVEEDLEHAATNWMPTGAYFEHYCDYQADQAQPPLPSGADDLERSDEYGVHIIHSIETDTSRRMNINVSNRSGAISNLGADACVEVPCLVDRTGIHPCAVGKLPPQLAALCRSNVAVQRLAVKGAIENDLERVRQAIKLDPLTAASCTLDEIDEMVDRLLEANAAYLPDAFYDD